MSKNIFHNLDEFLNFILLFKVTAQIVDTLRIFLNTVFNFSDYDNSERLVF